MWNKNDDLEENKTDNRTQKRKIGDIGESVASMFLEKHGFKIMDRNYLRKYGEIDIVASKDGNVCFIEVKSVTHETSDGYRAEDNVHPWKLKRLARVIQAYILDKKVEGDWKFGVITVELNMETRMAKVKFLDDLVL